MGTGNGWWIDSLRHGSMMVDIHVKAGMIHGGVLECRVPPNHQAISIFDSKLSSYWAPAKHLGLPAHGRPSALKMTGTKQDKTAIAKERQADKGQVDLEPGFFAWAYLIGVLKKKKRAWEKMSQLRPTPTNTHDLALYLNYLPQEQRSVTLIEVRHFFWGLWYHRIS